MRASDMVIVDMDGKRLAGKRRVSSELAMHLLIYRLRPDVHGIVHAHPPTATGFAASGYDLNRPLVCEVVVGLGSSAGPLWHSGHTRADRCPRPLIPHHDAILMANHGVVTFGSSVESAYMKWKRSSTSPRSPCHTPARQRAAARRKRSGEAPRSTPRYNGGSIPTPRRRPVAADTLQSDSLESDGEPKETTGSRR